ncbi:hypothetical protein Y032_0349g3205 [Ancylostoma ceylanicum]|uniref:Uncharacterized protein n=1 Tax=Ancylostoma ceylanicum TaxID=53326 RepID=A0A016RWU1_9BILA|nr:hypothetical protein Y032_0349g3205 [Ancylostoma ceylanicum]
MDGVCWRPISRDKHIRPFGSRVDASIQLPKFEVRVAKWWRIMNWIFHLQPTQVQTLSRGSPGSLRRTQSCGFSTTSRGMLTVLPLGATLMDTGNSQGFNRCRWPSYLDSEYLPDLIHMWETPSTAQKRKAYMTRQEGMFARRRLR